MIHTEKLTKQFGNFTAVEELTLDVAPGELFALLGPNGAGKTTTVRMLACLIGPTSGKATVVGRPLVEGCDEIRARVGLLTEAPGLYEQLSAWQNLLIFANLYGVEKPEAQVEKYLRLLELWDRRNEPTGGFSKGMKQKVAIARALLHEPELLFLDEPTSGLDPSAAKVVRDFLAELKQSGRTILLTTHNLDEAERLADRIGVLNRRLIALDTPEQLRRRLFGRHTLVRLAAPEPALAEIACGVAGVQKVTWNASTLVVSLNDPDVENPALIAALVGAGARIQAVTEERATLEQIYLQLIGEEGE
ncbi:MAG: ABC transporter ATP-binding protein [Ardenticatenales bacterium]|nr:ABC transporter ATP-binding protein [Ardenticatenales bacterium]